MTKILFNAQEKEIFESHIKEFIRKTEESLIDPCSFFYFVRSTISDFSYTATYKDYKFDIINIIYSLFKEYIIEKLINDPSNAPITLKNFIHHTLTELTLGAESSPEKQAQDLIIKIYDEYPELIEKYIDAKEERFEAKLPMKTYSRNFQGINNISSILKIEDGKEYISEGLSHKQAIEQIINFLMVAKNQSSKNYKELEYLTDIYYFTNSYSANYKSVLESTVNFLTNEKSKKLLEKMITKIENQESTLYLTKTPGHAISYVVTKDYIFDCNRGDSRTEQTSGIIVYKKPANFDESNINYFATSQDYINFSNTLGEPVHHFEMSPQKIGNCFLHACMMPIIPILATQKVSSNPGLTIEQAMEQVKPIYKEIKAEAKKYIEEDFLKNSNLDSLDNLDFSATQSLKILCVKKIKDLTDEAKQSSLFSQYFSKIKGYFSQKTKDQAIDYINKFNQKDLIAEAFEEFFLNNDTMMNNHRVKAYVLNKLSSQGIDLSSYESENPIINLKLKLALNDTYGAFQAIQKAAAEGKIDSLIEYKDFSNKNILKYLLKYPTFEEATLELLSTPGSSDLFIDTSDQGKSFNYYEIDELKSNVKVLSSMLTALIRDYDGNLQKISSIKYDSGTYNILDILCKFAYLASQSLKHSPEENIQAIDNLLQVTKLIQENNKLPEEQKVNLGFTTIPIFEKFDVVSGYENSLLEQKAVWDITGDYISNSILN